jgi:hypothetical protein
MTSVHLHSAFDPLSVKGNPSRVTSSPTMINDLMC